MKRTNDYLDMLAELNRSNGGTGTDYAIAKLLGVGHSRISNYRHGRSRFDNETCVLIAQLLDIPEGEVLANIYAEREKNPALVPVWEKMAKAASKTAAIVAFAAVAVPALIYSHPTLSQENQSFSAVYYVKGNVRHLSRQARWLF